MSIADFTDFGLDGERPFRGERDNKLLMQQILNAEAPPPRSS